MVVGECGVFTVRTAVCLVFIKDRSNLQSVSGNVLNNYGNLPDGRIVSDVVRSVVRSLRRIVELLFSDLEDVGSCLGVGYIVEVRYRLSAALLNGRKYNGLLTVVFYLVLMFALQCLTGLATWAFIPEGTSVNRVILLRGAVSLVFAGLAYAAAAETMERKLSV